MDGRPTALLSRQLGLPVVTGSGERLGELADLTVPIGPGAPDVRHLLVRSGHAKGCLVAWRDVAALREDGIVLREGAATRAVNPSQPPLESQEVLLARDVMDTQVVDLRGLHLSRVSDVLLEPGPHALQVAAVDLGSAGLLRRVGPRWLPAGRPTVVVAWPDLHLTSRRGHQVQLSTETASFRRLDARGLAELFARLSPRKAADLVRALDPVRAGAALHRSHPHTGRRLVRALSPRERQRLREAAGGSQQASIAELDRRPPPLRGRRFLRTAGWRLHRPPRR